MDSSARRILALWLPHLPTDRLHRRWNACGRPDKRPLAIAEKQDNALRLTAVDAAAARIGLYPGKALADARAMISDLAVICANEAADTKLLDAVAGWCERYTPLVALDPPHGLLLDITGAAHLFDGETVMLEEVRRAIAAQGFAMQSALAGTAEAARALAHYAPNAIVAPGREAETVAALPTEALNTDPHIVHALKRAGLKTIGQVAARTRHELAARFGSDFITLLDRTLGRQSGPITPRTPLPDLMAERRFAEPIVTQAMIGETLLSLAKSLASFLESRGEGARVLEAFFFRSDGQLRRIAIETGQPTRDAEIFARLFGEKLAALADPLDPGFGFDLIRLLVRLAQPLQAQAASLDANAADAEVDLLVDRLATRFGAHRVLRFQPQDTHIPEAAAVAVPAQHCEAAKQSWQMVRGSEEAPRRPLRLFAKAEPMEMLAQVPDGSPLRFRWRHILHAVAKAEGPERIAMEWWRNQEPRLTRDYYRVENDVGQRFWLYRDGIQGREIAHPRWYVHGLFA